MKFKLGAKTPGGTEGSAELEMENEKIGSALILAGMCIGAYVLSIGIQAKYRNNRSLSVGGGYAGGNINVTSKGFLTSSLSRRRGIGRR